MFKALDLLWPGLLFLLLLTYLVQQHRRAQAQRAIVQRRLRELLADLDHP